MQFLPVPVALLLSAVAGAATTGATFPPQMELAPGELRLIPIGGCHAEIRNHHVPEYGETMRHSHRRNCDPVPARRSSSDDAPVDCHRDVRTHRIGGIMLRHRHVGKKCALREVRQSS